MSIIYALIAREDTQGDYGDNVHVLVEASNDSTGNFPQVTRELILKQVPRNQKSIYTYKDKYIYHTLNEDNFTYLCLTDGDYPKRTAMAFLEDIKQSFTQRYPFDQRIKAISYGFNDSFSDVLTKKMAYFNENSLDPKMARIRNDAKATLGIMEENLESIMERGEKIELLVKKATNLNVESSGLKQRSNALKNKERREKIIKYAIAGAGVAILVYLFFFS